MNNSSQCRICKSNNLRSFEATEMMYGVGETFEYNECLDCKSLQIAEIPENLGKYYPTDYYSFKHKIVQSQPLLKSKLKKYFAASYLEDKNKLLVKLFKKRFGLGELLKRVKPANVNFKSSILDVGCGNGNRLISLSKYGFENLTGIDPYIEKDIYYDKANIHVYKKSIYEQEGKYDVVVLNHVFEHLIDPKETLEKAKTLLKKEGTLIIAMPVAHSFSSRKYAQNWVALDPPRHVQIYSFDAFKKFAENIGFKLFDSHYDSTSFQFIGSEQYLKGITLRGENSFYENPTKSIFTAKQISEYENLAKELNLKEDGDTACYYLKTSII